MKILNIEISPKTEAIIKEMSKSFKKGLLFHNLSKMDHSGVSAFGAADYDSDPKSYLIYLSTNLQKQEFETNLLHELLHITQIENSIVRAQLKNNSIVKKENTPKAIREYNFFSGLNVGLNSSIMDLDVIEKLKSLGYSSLYFTDIRFEKILEPGSCLYNDKYDFAYLTVQLVLFLLTARNEQCKEVVSYLNQNFNNLAEKSVELSKKISDIGFSTPLQRFLCLGELIEALNLWDIMKIEYNDTVLKTSKQFINFKNSI